MSTILEMLFDVTNRSLRRRGPLGVLVGLLLIVYVEIPVITTAASEEIQSAIGNVTRNLQTSERKLAVREHQAMRGHRQPRQTHHERRHRAPIGG